MIKTAIPKLMKKKIKKFSKIFNSETDENNGFDWHSGLRLSSKIIFAPESEILQFYPSESESIARCLRFSVDQKCWIKSKFGQMGPVSKERVRLNTSLSHIIDSTC